MNDCPMLILASCIDYKFSGYTIFSDFIVILVIKKWEKGEN